MTGHHLIMGELMDFLTGAMLPDTHDERYRQQIARLLIESKGYAPDELASRAPLQIQAGTKQALLKVDFVVTILDRTRMIIKYGPGSLVTRRRPALALSRLLRPYQIPVVVVANGVEAEILDGETGKLLATGLDSIPARDELLRAAVNYEFALISAERAEKEARIVYAYEIDDSCPCDDTICRLNE